jgi:hypothetical protein
VCAREGDCHVYLHEKTRLLRLGGGLGFHSLGEREMTEDEPEFSKNLLRGAEEIAEFLFGKREMKRRVYHLVATSKSFPHFKLGSMICARKSVLLTWVKRQEDR